jgi:hypothetical protein
VFPYPRLASLTNMQKDVAANFTGIKIGDIVTTADAQNRPADGNSGTALEMVLNQQRMGDEIIIQMQALQFQDIGSAQYGLRFDHELLHFMGFEGAGWAINATNAEEGSLALSWFSRDGRPVTIAAGTPVVTLRFLALNNSVSLREPLLQLAESALESEAIALPNGANFTRRVPLLLHAPSNVTAVEKTSIEQKYALGQNIPNPANHITLIPFRLAQEEEVNIKVYNQTGSILRQVTQVMSEGDHQVSVLVEDLVPGVYFYSIQTGRFSSTRSMIITEYHE